MRQLVTEFQNFQDLRDLQEPVNSVIVTEFQNFQNLQKPVNSVIL
jgi:hypothetical protein